MAAPTPPTIEPKTFQAGNTFTFTRTFADYGTGWTLSYRLVSPTLPAIDIPASFASGTYTVAVASATTSGWAPGDYRMSGYVTDGTNRYSVYDDDLTITPDLGVEATADTRTWAEKTLADVEAMLAGSLVRPELSYSINGRTYSFRTTADLLRTRDYLRADIAHDRAQKAGHNRRIVVQF